jgi:hypothetical protein
MQLLDSIYTNRLISANSRQRRTNLSYALWFAAVMFLGGIFGLLMLQSGPTASHIAWVVYLAGVLTIFLQPRYGIYLLIFLSLIGDGTLTYSLPFTKNFSSSESLLYLHDALVVSPLETYILFIFVSWLGRGAMQRKVTFYQCELFWPALVFIAFMGFGLVYGIGTGGNVNIALWESRAIFYMVAMLILASNLLTERKHFHNALWFAMVALFIEGLIGSYYFLVTLRGSLAGVEAITDHSAAIHMNSFFVYMLAAWLYRETISKRILLPLMILPVLLTYLATQRRAAFVTLIVALGLITIFLYKENRRAFWLIVPTAVVIGVLYLGAFWNSGSALGQPAQAVKSVIAEDQANEADQSSNIYRQIENLNTGFTIHQRPLTGVGFGQKFYIVWEMADISFFEWWEYLPHNSIIWIWLKAGVGGFVAMLYLVGKSIMLGSRTLLQMHKDPMGAVALTATLYILMHFIYAYVDISWDTQSMVYVGMTMGMLGAVERVIARPEPQPQKRWPWQQDPVGR